MACNGYTRTTMTSQSRGCPPTTNTYAHCGVGAGDGAGAPCRDMYVTATQERGDLQGLNDRLAGYLQKLQGLQKQPHVDPAKYREAMQMIENEMTKLKRDYEGELDRLRKALEDCCREKNNMALNMNKNGANMSDLHAKVNDLQGQLQRALADNQALCAQLANKDKDLADMACRLKAYQNELDHIKPDYNRLKQDADDCKRRLDCELKAKADDGCRIKQMLDKSQFDNNNKDQQIRDLQDRLKATNDIIAALENKIRQLSNDDGAQLGALLQKIRDGTAADIRRQQQATEDALNKSLMSLKCQINTDAQDKNGLQQEKARLQELVQQLQTKLSDMEGRLTACCTENQTLRSELDRERTCSQQEIRNLDQKLRELHAQMMAKIKECGEARDQQVSLNAEISNYRSLLDVVEAKAKHMTAPTTAPPPSDASTRLPVIPAPTFARSGPTCASMTPANVLGASLGGPRGGACCGSCASGGPCDAGRPAQTNRYTCDQYNGGGRGNVGGSQRITAEFTPAGNGYGSHNRAMTSRSHSGGRAW